MPGTAQKNSGGRIASRLHPTIAAAIVDATGRGGQPQRFARRCDKLLVAPAWTEMLIDATGRGGQPQRQTV
jgi:hypothetical protein